MKTQDLGKVTSVEIPEQLQDWNEENSAQRARLNFVYCSKISDLDEGEDEDARALLGEVANGQRYSIMVDLEPLEGNTTEDKRKTLEDKLKGKKVMFTTYVINIAKLLEGVKKYEGVTTVNNGERDYRTLNESYLGKNDNETDVFETMQTRLIRQLENEDLFTGSIADKPSRNRR